MTTDSAIKHQKPTEETTFWWVDFLLGFRWIEPDGPAWPPMAFFNDPNKEYKHGRLDTSRMNLRFEGLERPEADMFSFFGLLCCSRYLYTALFEQTIKDCVQTYSLDVSGRPFLCIKPLRRVGAIDLDRSRYRSRGDGSPYDFRKIALKYAPSSECSIFLCDGANSLNFYPIVSEEFKRIYESNDLTGLKFRNVWPNPQDSADD